MVREWLNVNDSIETIDGSYCVDFGVDMKQGSARLIELSPFRPCSGSAPFAWKQNESGARSKLLFPVRSDVQDLLISPLLVTVCHEKNRSSRLILSFEFGHAHRRYPELENLWKCIGIVGVPPKGWSLPNHAKICMLWP